MRLPLLALTALVLAGCVSPGTDTAPAAATPPAPAPRSSEPPGPTAPTTTAAPETGAGFGAPIVAIAACDGACFEPTVAVDAAGRIFVTEVNGETIARSDDDGASFQALAPPRLPEGAPEGATRSDTLLSTDAEGRLYYSALVLQRTGTTLLRVPLIHGIQVARSDDAGSTWTTNTFLSMLADPTRPIEMVDRQWIGFGADDIVYASWSQVPTGIWVARSDDAGASWSAPTRALGVEGRANLGMSGPPAVDADGRVFVAGIANMHEGGTPAVQIARSGDDGATWTVTTAVKARTPIDAPFGFPMVAFAADGTGFLSWSGELGQVRLATSEDGESWSSPRELSGDASYASPWIIALGGHVDLVWHEQISEDAYDVIHARLEGDRFETRVVAAGVPGNSGNTHLAHFAHAPDGRVVVTWSTSANVLVAVER